MDLWTLGGGGGSRTVCLKTLASNSPPRALRARGGELLVGDPPDAGAGWGAVASGLRPSVSFRLPSTAGFEPATISLRFASVGSLTLRAIVAHLPPRNLLDFYWPPSKKHLVKFSSVDPVWCCEPSGQIGRPSPVGRRLCVCARVRFTLCTCAAA